MAPELGEVECPYFYCSATVSTVTSTNPSSLMRGTLLFEHDIKHPILSGACIASLMYYPVNDQVKAIFRKQQLHDAELIALHNAHDPFLHKGELPESGPMGGDRLGRVAPKEDNEWKWNHEDD